MNTIRVLSDREVDALTYRTRRQAILAGCGIGAFLALVVAVVVGIGLDVWRARSYEREIAAAEARVAVRLAECRDTVSRLSGYPYEQVAGVQRQIDAAQGRRGQ